MSDLTEVEVAKAVTLIDGGRTYQHVANVLNVSKSVVHRVVRRHRETGSYKRRRGQGPKFATSSRDNRFMVLTSLRNRTFTHVKVRNELQRSRGVNVSTRTVRRRLADTGIRSYRALRAPKLTPAHREKRREYARKYGQWTEEQWSNVLFTDECRFCLEPDDRRVKVLRRPKERDFQCNIIETVQFGGGSIMVWAGITLGGRTVLHVVEGGTLTAAKYVRDILEPIVVPFIPFIGERFVLMHDNARPHTANCVREYLEEEDIDVLSHPPRSPDMNPIEHVWDHLKRQLREKSDKPTTLAALKRLVVEEWDKMSQDIVDNLIRGMPRRLEALARVRGGNTRY